MSALFEKLLYLCCTILMPKHPAPPNRQRPSRPRTPDEFGR